MFNQIERNPAIWLSLTKNTHPKSKKSADLDESSAKLSSKTEEMCDFG